MEKRINWLHISDLHCGQDSQALLFPKLKWEILKDIERIIKTIGPLDIVFFSGDLTQSGSKKEFVDLTNFLVDFWELFDKLDNRPYLLAVPGNHDLDRSGLNKMTVRALKSYPEDHEIREEFWLDITSKGDYFSVISNCFKNYFDWYEQVNLPKPNLKHGLMPGDFSSTLEINDLRVNIMGLNSTFLEMSNDDFKGRLALNNHQLHALAGFKYHNWLESGDLNLLMTHQDPSWYEKDSLEFYNSELNSPNSYFAHLCGHLHSPSALLSGQLGTTPRRIQLAPSLFGLQKINGKIDRIHGYFAGSYIFNDSGMTDLFYPRRKGDKIDGSYSIEAHTGFDFNRSGHILTLNPNLVPKKKATSESIGIDLIADSADAFSDVIDVMDLKAVVVTGLEKVPRIQYPYLPQHGKIRVLEQKNFVNELTSKRICWLVTDWGFGEEGFIGSVHHELDIMDTHNNFILDCEDFSTIEEFQDGFLEQFGIAFLKFCSVLAKLDNHTLQFNKVNPTLYQSISQSTRFESLLNTLIDYCPKTYIILTTREIPKFLNGSNIIKLNILDAPDVRSYVDNHLSKDKSLDRSENFSRLFDQTGGLPNHIDNFLQKLRIYTIEEILEDADEASIELIDTELIDKTLQQAVLLLKDSGNKTTERSFRLLKILTVLSHGETLGNLKRFEGSDPFLHTHALQLESSSLLEITTVNRLLSQMSEFETDQVKIVRIPRHVRDYVNTLISEAERLEILKKGCDLYFGNKWKEGNIKNVHSTILKSREKFLNTDNCKLIIKLMLSLAIQSKNELEIGRAAMLAVNYCVHVFDNQDFKNAGSCAEEVYHLLKGTNLEQQKAIIARTYGKSLRMSNQPNLSMEILNEALNMKPILFSNSERASMLINLGYIYERKGQYKEAVEILKDVERLAGKGSAFALTAQYIIAICTLQGENLLRKLRGLETSAKKIGSIVLANNISISISGLSIPESDKNKRYEKILSESNDNYNVIRAIATKSLQILEKNKGDISDQDLLLLSKAYSYLHSQKMPELFLQCHKALWLICIKRDLIANLVNLFRYSSFFWRIQGFVEPEQKYFDELNKNYGIKINELLATGQININGEYFNRRKIEFEKSMLLLQ